MAWNDIYKTNDKAVQLLVTVNGKQFNFRHAVDLKVERKIGDTMSKFSLGIVGDDSEDFYNFEQQILRYGTEIKVSYGNSTKAMSNFIGIVIDYQPVFLGNSTKLTVTGYLSKITAGTSVKKLTSAYTYWIDWVPLIGIRRRENEEWAEIYNGKFRFDSDMSVDGIETQDDKILTEEEANQMIEGYLSSYDSHIKAAEANLLEAVLAQLNSQTYVYSSCYGDPDTMMSRPVLTNGGITYVKIYRVSAPEVDGEIEHSLIRYLGHWANDPDGIEDIMVVGEPEETKQAGDFKIQMMPATPSHIRELEKAYTGLLDNKANLEVKLRKIYSEDTWGNLSGLAWDYGHVPWTDVINKYKGNVEFSEFKHPVTGNSIWRVRPDLFVEWDNDLPGAPEYMNDESDKRESGIERAEEFPDSAINDIKVFGLKYYFDKERYLENTGDPYSAYSLSPFDMHGKLRVFNANNKYYIWVGDVPELYQKWKNYADKNGGDWGYNSKKDEAGKITNAKQFQPGGSYKTGDYIVNSWVGYKTETRVVGDNSGDIVI